MILNILFYAVFPVLAVILGGVIAAFRPPGERMRSAVQHFAAGIVFAAIALELLPEIKDEREPLAAILGFAIGIGLMLAIKIVVGKFGEKAAETEQPAAGENAPDSSTAAKFKRSAAAQPTPQNKQPTSLLITLGIDILVDGLLIGIGFAAGAKQGLMLLVALSIEALFLGLSAAVALSQIGASRAKIIGANIALGSLLAVGVIGGVFLFGNMTGAAKEIVLSFGAAALLYLVTEELLVEAHEEPETPLLTAMFFVGFVVLLVVEMIA
jgi:zinc transporter, ZIP family